MYSNYNLNRHKKNNDKTESTRNYGYFKLFWSGKEMSLEERFQFVNDEFEPYKNYCGLQLHKIFYDKEGSNDYFYFLIERIMKPYSTLFITDFKDLGVYAGEVLNAFYALRKKQISLYVLDFSAEEIDVEELIMYIRNAYYGALNSVIDFSCKVVE